ncbi:MAG: RDD family protein [Candidatus Izimaplasma sp.]|nr:RDD family protein [Candidatus Izimaplasma bacterium]
MPEYHHLPAQFNERINAFATDMIPVFTSALIVVFMQFDLALKILIMVLSWYSMNILPYHFLNNQTLGKKWAELIVINDNRTTTHIKTLYAREIFKVVLGVGSAGLYYLISFIYAQNRKDKRSIHDQIFNTKVVNQFPKIT